MGIVKGIVDFALFKEFVTPGFIKILYFVIFVLMNLGFLAMMGFMILTGAAGALAMMRQSTATAVAGVVVALIVIAAMLAMLVVYNLILRAYFEIILLMFNIHGYLKSIDEKTQRK